MGLTDNEVLVNRKKYGSNEISKIKTSGFFQLLFESLGDPIIKILLIALGIKIFFTLKEFDWFETIGIVIAILIASFISAISEYGSNKAFQKLQAEASKIKTRVMRNGKIVEISIDEVVKDDLVILSVGDKVPADGVLVKGDLYLDESSLNGETKEIHKYIGGDVNLFRGAVVYSKEGEMRVTAVGDSTFYGKLALEIQEDSDESPLKLRLRGLAEIISKLGYLAAILAALAHMFSAVVLKNNFQIDLIIETITNGSLMFKELLYSLTLCVTIIVVAVPEGLPMMITLVLSSNMRRMLKNNVLVRKMVGIETAGNLNILFTDKTGTLTKGKLEVVGFIDPKGRRYNNESDLYKHSKFHELVKLSMTINNASSRGRGSAIGGNITDRALLNFIESDIPHHEKINVIPFDSKNKYSITEIKGLSLIKGAPEVILGGCTRYYDIDGNEKVMTDKKVINKLIENITKEGVRVLAFATFKEKHVMTFVGLALIKDEVRNEAIEGINLVKKAHIQTVMITGDNKDTACAIAREVGLLENGSDVILTSAELNKYSDEELSRLLPRLRVVARSLPQDKSRLVKIAKEAGLVVGMTGDGVNDAPALKKADVGFSMGSGTEVSKEASDIVILDDNFLSISKAILFGRTIFKSIRKFIIFQLTINLCAVSLSILGPFIGVETPVTIIQMLWINMVMDTLAGLAFSFEPPLLEYMNEKPLKKDAFIINRYMKGEILFTGFYISIICILFLKLPLFKEIFRVDDNHIYLLTAFFALFIFISVFNSFNARTSRLNIFKDVLRNKVFLVIIIFIIFVQILMIYFGGNLFRTTALTLLELNVVILLAATVIPIDWIRKLYLKKKNISVGV